MEQEIRVQNLENKVNLQSEKLVQNAVSNLMKEKPTQAIELAVKGMQQGACDFIEKPWNNQKLIALVESHINASPSLTNDAPSRSVANKNNWIAESSAMQQLEDMQSKSESLSE